MTYDTYPKVPNPNIMKNNLFHLSRGENNTSLLYDQSEGPAAVAMSERATNHFKQRLALHVTCYREALITQPLHTTSPRPTAFELGGSPQWLFSLLHIKTLAPAAFNYLLIHHWEMP